MRFLCGKFVSATSETSEPNHFLTNKHRIFQGGHPATHVDYSALVHHTAPLDTAMIDSLSGPLRLKSPGVFSKKSYRALEAGSAPGYEVPRVAGIAGIAGTAGSKCCVLQTCVRDALVGGRHVDARWRTGRSIQQCMGGRIVGSWCAQTLVDQSMSPGGFPKWGYTQIIHWFIGFFITNHPFWGTVSPFMICMETTISTICSAMTSMIVTPSMLRGFILPWVAASGPVPVASGKATKRARAYGDRGILAKILLRQNVTHEPRQSYDFGGSTAWCLDGILTAFEVPAPGPPRVRCLRGPTGSETSSIRGSFDPQIFILFGLIQK